MNISTATTMTPQSAASATLSIAGVTFRFLRDNRPFTLGVSLLLALALFGYVGRLFVDQETARMGGATYNLSPSQAHPLGTDGFGRDVFTLLVLGVPNTFKIGLLAGALGVAIGTVFGLFSGYYRTAVDTVIRSTADVMLVIPGLAILITISALVRVVTVDTMALIVGLLAWPLPTRVIRAQVLSLRERPYVDIAKLSGEGGVEILFREIGPNLLPYLAAAFVGAVSTGILAAVGLEVLGLGPQTTPTIGRTLYHAFDRGAMFQGMWWWWAPPLGVLAIIFGGLFLMSMGLDRYANPRLQASRVKRP